MAAIFIFFILRVISYFDNVDPVLIRFSMVHTPYMQIFMLSSESAHLFDISTQLVLIMNGYSLLLCFKNNGWG